jgi:hypothetical protein
LSPPGANAYKPVTDQRKSAGAEQYDAVEFGRDTHARPASSVTLIVITLLALRMRGSRTRAQ